MAIAGALSLTAVSTLSACGHGSSSAKAAAPSTSARPTASVSAAGDFGTLKAICGPGKATGATARGVTDTEIHIGTLADPNNTVLPGIGQESFDVGTAFAKWCNAAGGILGRKIVLSEHDSGLFNVAAKMIDACRSDFMLVASANPLDAAGVKPRLACNLAQIPAYVTSSQAATAGEQVVIDSSIPQVAVGEWRALSKKFPAAFQAISLITVNGAGLDSFAERQRDALTSLGYKVVNFQKAPVTGVANWRPYVESARLAGAKAAITLSPDVSALVRSFGDVGWKPDVLPLGVQNYNAGTIELAKAGVLPTTYVTTTYWPFEAADRSPAVRQAIAPHQVRKSPGARLRAPAGAGCLVALGAVS